MPNSPEAAPVTPQPASGTGRWLVFEGLDGVGKTTQISLLADWLRARGQEFLRTAEPGGTVFGRRLEELLKHELELPPVARAEALLFLAARAEHVERVIRPALASGVWVLCDRFHWSTLAYQGWGHALDLEALAAADAWAREGCQPDRIYYLEAPDEVLEARRQGRPGDRIEARSDAYRQRVRAGYEALVAGAPGAVVERLAAEGVPEVVQAALRASLEAWL